MLGPLCKRKVNLALVAERMKPQIQPATLFQHVLHLLRSGQPDARHRRPHHAPAGGGGGGEQSTSKELYLLPLLQSNLLVNSFTFYLSFRAIYW